MAAHGKRTPAGATGLANAWGGHAWAGGEVKVRWWGAA